MKNLVALRALTAALALSAQAWAGGAGECHFHGNKPAAQATVQNCASQYKETLIKKGKLDKSWQTVPVDKIEQVDGKSAKEWKVSFKDASAKDKSKETLYMFYTLPGNLIAANFTGQ